MILTGFQLNVRINFHLASYRKAIHVSTAICERKFGAIGCCCQTVISPRNQLLAHKVFR